MNFIARFLFELQEMSLLAGRAARGIFRKPHYVPEAIAQMDYIGVGSLTIIVLTGFFTGGVLTLQTYQTLESYGAVDQLGYLVSISDRKSTRLNSSHVAISYAVFCLK